MIIEHNGIQYETHPASDLFPLTLMPDLQDLADDIKKRGLLFPITRDGDGRILEGRNRLRACNVAKVSARFDTYTGDDPVGFVIAANIHRRHLTPAQKRDLIKKLLKLNPEKSDRQIAAEVKADNKTVAGERRKAEAREEIPHVEKRTDTKGRRQPAAKPKPKSVQLAEVTLAKNRQTPEMQSAGALMNFKYAADHWVPKMNAADLEKAKAYFQQKTTRAIGNAEIFEDEHRARMEKLGETKH
jgi:ParB-like chromosome segregation protein Spo0J